MKKKGLFNRFKRLSKPTGSPQWGHAFRAIFLMVIAGLIAQFLGFQNGISAIMFVTLLASIIIDTALPIKKVAILGLSGLLMTTLAFISASLALSSLEIFILFTVIWSFFSISLYIFGTMEGSLGFTFFLTYFVAVLMVNNQSSTLDWAIYSIIAYLVASVLFIPKIWLEKKRIRNMVTVGFNPGSSIQNILLTRNILSGIPINSNYMDIFKFGCYLKSLRTYSDMITSRFTSRSQSNFKNFLNTSDKFSLKIAEHFRTDKGPVDLKEIDANLSLVESQFLKNKNNSETVIKISHGLRDLLYKSNAVLSRDPGKEMDKVRTPKKSLQEVLEANFNLNNLYIRHAIRFTISITIALILVYLTRERSVIWITMGVLIILKPDITSTMDNLISRVGFNFFAIIIAIIISFIFPHYLLVWLAFIMLFLFRAFYPNYMGLSVMSITVFIVLIWPTGTVFENAIIRLVDIALGGIIAFICAYIILPSRITINLPDLLTRTIKANINYAKQVLFTSTKDFNNKKLILCLKNYMTEENNLEAGVKKLEDTFNDINDDVSLYHEIIAVNNKMAANLTALAAVLNKDRDAWTNRNTDIIKSKDALQTLENSLNGDICPLKISLDEFSIGDDNNEKVDDLEQLISWITSDLQLIQKGFEISYETGLLKRYTKLT